MNSSELQYVTKALAELPDRVRGDIALTLLTVTRAVPSHWRTGRAAPMLWIVVDDTPDGGRPTATTHLTHLSELTRSGYLDDIHHSFGPDVRARVKGHRCAALAYGDRIYGRTWGIIGMLVTGPPPADSFMSVHVVHSERREVRFSLRFTRRGVLSPIVRFDPAVCAHLAAIVAGDP
jgi:hypothetical protein